MGKIFDVVKSCLDNNEIKYSLHDDNWIFSMRFSGNSGSLRTDIFLDEEDEWVNVRCYLPNNIPVKYIDRLYPILNAMNKKTLFTKFVVDPEDGEISCRWSLNVDQGAINEKMVRVALYGAVNALDDEYENIMKEIYK